ELVQHVAQVHLADDIVEVASIDGQLRVVTGGELVDDVVPVVLEVDALDAAARDHDVVDGDRFQLEDAQQHLLVAARNELGRLLDDGAKLLGAQRVVAPFQRDAEYSRQQRTHGVDADYDRARDLDKERERVDGPEGDLLGVQGGHGLGRYLGEDEHDQRDRSGGEGDGRLAGHLDGDDRGHRGGR